MLVELDPILFKSNQPEEGAIGLDMKIHMGPLGGVFKGSTERIIAGEGHHYDNL